MNGLFNIVWLGDGFSRRNEEIFHDHCNHAEEFLQTLAPIDSFIAADQVRFQRKISKGNLNCRFFGFETIQCNWEKVIQAGTIDGIIPDLIHVFALGKGFGTGNGGISVLGIGNGVPSSADLCEYWSKLVRLDAHEIGHALGLGHSLVPAYPQNLMSQATNGGCELGFEYLPGDQVIITNYMNMRIALSL